MAVLASLEHGSPIENTGDTGGRDRKAHALMRVIESMTIYERYVHGYHSQENQRLSDQAGTLIELRHSVTGTRQGSRYSRSALRSVGGDIAGQQA